MNKKKCFFPNREYLLFISTEQRLRHSFRVCISYGNVKVLLVSFDRYTYKTHVVCVLFYRTLGF